MGSPAYVMARRLHILRSRLKNWCLDKKLFWGINWKQIIDHLQHYGNQVQTCEQGRVFFQRQRPIVEELSVTYSYWRQRMKEKFIQEGDLPTKLLFRRLSQKRQQNYIHMLKAEDGTWVSQQADLESLIQRHFKAILTSNGGGPDAQMSVEQDIDLVLRELDLPVIPMVDYNSLLQPLSAEEVQLALFSLPEGKSPGLDGYNVEFFKYYWSTVGGILTAVVQRFFATGHLLKEWNQTLIILIPKVNPSVEVNHL